MIFLIASIFIPLIIFLFLPPIIKLWTGKEPRLTWVLLLACFLYFISWYLPSPAIDGANTSFTTHVVGGGLFGGCLWLYCKAALGWNESWWLELFSLFAFVSALGVINELVELLVVRLGVVLLALTDTSWDLVANTVGLLVFWIIYRVANGLWKESPSR